MPQASLSKRVEEVVGYLRRELAELQREGSGDHLAPDGWVERQGTIEVIQTVLDMLEADHA